MTRSVKRVLLLTLMSSVFFLIFLYSTGALLSGFHLTEDHNLIKMKGIMLSGQGFLETVITFMKSDHNRVRIVYFFRTFLYTIFGLNMDAFRWVYFVMGTLTLTMLSAWFRSYLKLHTLIAFLFASLILVGPQMNMWWRLEAHENIGIFFLALTLHLAIMSVRENKSFGPWRAGWFLSMLALTFSKESSMIIIPSMVLLKIILDAEQNSKPVLRAALNRTVESVFFAAVVLIQIMIIRKYSQTVIEYWGETHYTIENYVRTFGQMLEHGYSIIVCGSIAVFIAALVKSRKNQNPEELKFLGLKCFFCVVFVFSAITLIQGPGVLQPHYLIPAEFGILFFCGLLFGFSKAKAPIASAAIPVLLVLVLVMRGQIAYDHGKAFAEEGRISNTILSETENRTGKNSRILFVLDPARNLEWGYAMRKFMIEFIDRENLYLFPIMRPQYTKYEKFLIDDSPYSPFKQFAGKWFLEMKQPVSFDVVLVYPYNELMFRLRSRSWFDPTLYDRQRIDKFTLYTRKRT